MTSWKLTFPCTRAEAEAAEVPPELAEPGPAPVLLTSERVPDDPAAWQIDAYFEAEPSKPAIAAIRALVPSAGDAAPELVRLEDEDWVTMSQQGLEPVHAGRFYVHTAANRGDVPPGTRAFRIEASRAFGTGQHDTTAGCLQALDRLKRRGLVVRNLADVGTGTGLLAFAALHLWPAAFAIASDIDAAAVEVTRDNARVNGVALGDRRGSLALATAPGLDHPLLLARAPYDLLIANILAGPLIALAPALGGALADGGTLVLAGLLEGQAATVAAAYRRQRLRLVARVGSAEWPTLVFVKRHAYGWRRPVRADVGAGETPGFGTW